MAQKSEINMLYNQDIAPQDSEKTSFYYHQILALECLIAIFSVVSMVVGLLLYFNQDQIFPTQKSKDVIFIFTVLTMIALVFQTLTRIKWLEEKKDIQKSGLFEYIFLVVELILVIPCPNRVFLGKFQTLQYSGKVVYLQIDDLLTVYLLGRAVYIFKFLIHSELFYGSRPDRLSRLYTVKFATFNSIKFLINQKPELVVIVILLFNFLYLPLLILLTQGKINTALNNYISCIYFVTVTQITVGYGQINVTTIFGRTVVLFCILIGVASSSLLLILFMRAMEQSNQEQESYFLLNNLQKRIKLKKARVNRIEHQWVFANSYYTPQERAEKQEKLKKFRFNNRRHILLQRQQPNNIKRLMLTNFSSVLQALNQVKQKQQILSKYINVIQKAKNTKDLEDTTKPKKNQKRLQLLNQNINK